MTALMKISWTRRGLTHESFWRSVTGAQYPRRAVAVDDQTRAQDAYRWASEGVGLVWEGDYHNARQLLSAMTRRLDRIPIPTAHAAKEAFLIQRRMQAHRARVLGMLLLPFEAEHRLALRRAPDVQAACAVVYGKAPQPYVAPLKEILGLIGAYEWRRKGVDIPAIGGRIFPHYGVFSPIRGEYIDLVAQAPLPSTSRAFDIGTGTGVLAAVLAKRGVQKVIATDQSPQALCCATENMAQLGLSQRVDVLAADLFPPGQAPLIVCNPPWVPAPAYSALDQAVYDPDSRMLKGFLKGLAKHLTPGGEGWLILSDLAEHLELRSRSVLLEWIAEAGLVVHARHDTRPKHKRVTDTQDALHAARAAEVTSLWRLKKAPG